MTSSINNNLLGNILIKQGMATPDQIEIALLEQKKSKDRLGVILVRLGFATEDIIRDVIGGIAGQQTINLDCSIADSEAVALVPQHIARKHHIFPVSFDPVGKTLTVAMIDTCNIVVLDQLRLLVGKDIEVIPVLAGIIEIEKAIDQFYGFELSIGGILREIETGEIDYKDLDFTNYAYNQPVVRLVNALLVDAVKHEASDIHFEPEEWFLRIRYRIDGVLKQIRSIHRNYWPAIAIRVKVMADMDIAEIRAPQDGRISLSISGRIVDFRVSTFPTLHGENIVLRVLDRHRCIMSLDKLDLQDDTEVLLQTVTRKPAGVVLVTGPTGSGKTTTLYALLNYLNEEAVHIVTLEDPVEYPMTLIRQTSIGATSRLDFAGGLGHLMRQDPDIILVGEIRDAETAQMALRAAMTGHKVFSTLHTNSASAAIPRLFDLGVQPDILSGSIIGIIGQRLVRRLCRICKQACAMATREYSLLGMGVPDKHQVIYRAAGCTSCAGNGYKGRLAVMEVLCFDTDLDEIVARRGTRHELLHAAVSRGFRTMAQAAVGRILEGSTSVDEVMRVIDLSDRITRKRKDAGLSIPRH